MVRQAMFVFPERVSLLKEDPLRRIKYCVTLWGQNHFRICLIIYCLKCFGLCSRSVFIYENLNDTEFVLEVALTIPVPILAVVKMGYLLWNRNNVAFLLNTITTRFWDLSTGGLQLQKSLSKRYFYVNWLLLIQASVSSFYVVLHLISASVPIPEGRTRWLPTIMVLPFDQDRSPTYEILFVLMTFSLFLSIWGNSFFDSLFIYLAQHVSGQFMMLRMLLRNLDQGLMTDKSDFDKFKSKTFETKIQHRISTCVRHHYVLLEYCKALKKLTSFIFGLHLFFSLMSLVLVGYKLAENYDEISNLASQINFVASVTAQFVLLALQSSEIEQQSASVAQAAYYSNWYLFNSNGKKALTLVMMNSQTGITMSGAGLVEIHNEIIVTMFQKVFSCITLLQSLAK